MGKLRPVHFFEAAFWLLLSAFLYVESFNFDRSIEIYKFGATAWPRTLILLMAFAALGQLLFQYYAGDSSTGSLGAATDDGAQEAARKAGHSSVSWYASTFLLLAIPFLYMRAPDLVGLMTTLDKQGVHLVKGVTAPILLVAYLVLMRGNHVGAILALPIFFAALLEDMGFYAMAPLFIIGVTLLMGERRLQWIALTIALMMGALLLTFVSLLYVGLPTGNLSPFYEFSNQLIILLQ